MIWNGDLAWDDLMRTTFSGNVWKRWVIKVCKKTFYYSRKDRGGSQQPPPPPSGRGLSWNINRSADNLHPFFPTPKSPWICIDLRGFPIWGWGANCPLCPPPMWRRLWGQGSITFISDRKQAFWKTCSFWLNRENFIQKDGRGEDKGSNLGNNLSQKCWIRSRRRDRRFTGSLVSRRLRPLGNISQRLAICSDLSGRQLQRISVPSAPQLTDGSWQSQRQTKSTGLLSCVNIRNTVECRNVFRKWVLMATRSPTLLFSCT